MRTLRLALPVVLAASLAACGAAGPNLPDSDTLDIQRPDDPGSASQGLDSCQNGDAFGARAKVELDELLAATRPYRDLYRGVRAVTAVTRHDGAFEHTWTGPKGSITVDSEEASDGSITITVDAAAKADNEASERKVMDGTVAADGLSGTWNIYDRSGTAVRTIDWTKTAAGDLTATWKNTQNGKTAVYTRTGTSADLKITNAAGESVDLAWDLDTHAGSVTLSGTSSDGEKCWDGNLCNVACGA